MELHLGVHRIVCCAQCKQIGFDFPLADSLLVCMLNWSEALYNPVCMTSKASRNRGLFVFCRDAWIS